MGEVMEVTIRCLLFCISLLFVTSAAALPVRQMDVFGDSLSDVHSRYTNGPMWMEYLSDNLGVIADPGDNFARVGATTAEIRQQVADFLATHEVDGETVYAVWGGSNDLFQAASSLDYLSPDFPDGVDLQGLLDQTIETGVDNLVAAVSSLERAGVHHVMVVDVPNLGQTPQVQTLDGVLPRFELGAFLTDGAARFNAALWEALDGVDVVRVDTYALLTDVVNHPQAYDFGNATDTCTAYHAAPECASFVFYDGIHPTSRAHSLIAGNMVRALSIDAPASVVLLATGLAVLVRRRRRLTAEG